MPRKSFSLAVTTTQPFASATAAMIMSRPPALCSPKLALVTARISALADAQSEAAAMPENERRRLAQQATRALEKGLNEDQLDTLRGLERFGWELKFVRRPPFKDPIPVVFDGDRKKFAILEPNGTLNEKPSFDIRH